MNHRLHHWLGRHERLFFAVSARRYPFNQMKVTRQTQICIEGFPRSANSYAVVVFRLANPGVTIGHHLHVPAQILRACRYGIPTVVLIRPPEEAVASFMLFQHAADADGYLRSYYEFYKTVLPLRRQFVAVDFALVVRDMNRVIEEVNQHFGTQFNRVGSLEAHRAEIERKLTESNRKFFAGEANKGLLPDAQREQAKQHLKKIVARSPFLQQARQIYQDFAALAVQ